MEEQEVSTVSKYEIMVILFPDLGEEKTNKELDKIKALITENGGEIFHEDIWGARDFAYRIKKEEQGFYAVFNFSLDPDKLKKLEDPLNLNQKVIRYLVIKTPANYEIKTFEEYEKDEASSAAEAERAKSQSSKKKEQPPKPTKDESIPLKEKPEEKPKKEEPKEEEPEKEAPKEEKPKEEKPKEEKPKEEKPKEEKPKTPTEKPEKAAEKPKKEPKTTVDLDDIDEKLKSIINDPDITL
jgi:ribosomal protein S6